MNLMWTDIAWEDYLYWQNTDKKNLIRINDLIKDIMRTPFAGLGKPEPLRLILAGKWSRRINGEHRLVYDVRGKKEKIDNRVLTVFQCRFHY